MNRTAGPLAAITFVLFVTGLRLWFGRLLPGVTVFSLYYPAILAASLAGGELAAALAVILSLAVVTLLFRNAQSLDTAPATAAFNLLVFLLTGGLVALVGAQLRRLLRRHRADLARLADREARYRALFEGVSEGVVLLEPVWTAEGRLGDAVIVEANPGILAMYPEGVQMVGHRYSEFRPDPDPIYIDLLERTFRGEPHRLEYYSPRRQRWFDVRLAPAGKDRVGQIVVDITDRKVAESRQSEMFDELNHRVKNNLAVISAMLGIQGRLAHSPEVREHLAKAVDRIQTIGDLHASLYQRKSSGEVDFAAYLHGLCDRLSSALLDGVRVRLEVEADPVMAPLDEAVALGLIVNELVTNAAKHAYPAPASGVIRVRLRNTPTELLLSVSDDGVGLSETASSNGIGMRIVRSLVQQRGGELQVGGDKGASFTIRLRAHDKAAEAGQNRLI